MDEGRSDATGVAVINAWTQSGGELRVRLTLSGDDHQSHVQVVDSVDEVVAIVRDWLEELSGLAVGSG